MLSGEGEYNLNILKEISVTDSFLDLDDYTRGCQNVEPFDNCTTRFFLNSLKEICGCIPKAINLLSQVYELIINIKFKHSIRVTDLFIF